MKRLAIIMVCALVATTSIHAAKPHVLASASIFEDMAKNIGGDLITLDKIVPVGADPHLYDPIPSDVDKVLKADLILINGLTFEGWISKLVDNSGTKAKSILITEGVKTIRSQDYENATDPHAWMTVSNAKIYAQNIYNALIAEDPENSAQYKSNLDTYQKELDELEGFIRNAVAEIPEEKRVVITSHDAFNYYGKEYGLRLEAIQGISTESEAQTSDVMRVSKVIRDLKIPSVFVESTINPKMLKQIATDNGATIGGELFADSLGEPDSEAGTYIGMMRYNTKTISAGLSSTNTKEATHNHSTSGESESSYLLYILIGAALLLMLLFFIIRMNR